MIHYQLQCASGHEFDGWFNSSASFDDQAARHLLECPRCGGHEVERAIMAPRIGGKASPAEVPAVIEAGPPVAADTAIAGPMPAALRAIFARMRREVEARCDYVGGAFAEEARRIHEGAAPARGIYGEATPDEAEALAEDGIDIARIPWVPLAEG
ncbi:DUF1178 family protein [Acidiphilium sp.]|uniref:DUF1178 family protein n=1 Tax=Acidiphilium sp. TaxID=527 RepID=UPI003CFBC69C